MDTVLFESESPSPATVDCPACGTEVEVEISYAIAPDSAELQALFEGRLNQFRCLECGAEFIFASPLIFRDAVARQVVYYLPLGERSAWAEAEKRIGELTEKVFADVPSDERPDCRLTFHRRNFIEKIAAHGSGIDDRLLEYVKYQLYNRPVDPIDQIRSELLFDFTQSNSRRLAFILFDRETGEATAAAHIPMATYDELADAFRRDPDMRHELLKLFPGLHVSVEKLYD